MAITFVYWPNMEVYKTKGKRELYNIGPIIFDNNDILLEIIYWLVNVWLDYFLGYRIINIKCTSWPSDHQRRHLGMKNWNTNSTTHLHVLSEWNSIHCLKKKHLSCLVFEICCLSGCFLIIEKHLTLVLLYWTK